MNIQQPNRCLAPSSYYVNLKPKDSRSSLLPDQGSYPFSIVSTIITPTYSAVN